MDSGKGESIRNDYGLHYTLVLEPPEDWDLALTLLTGKLLGVFIDVCIEQKTPGGRQMSGLILCPLPFHPVFVHMHWKERKTMKQRFYGRRNLVYLPISSLNLSS